MAECDEMSLLDNSSEEAGGFQVCICVCVCVCVCARARARACSLLEHFLEGAGREARNVSLLAAHACTHTCT